MKSYFSLLFKILTSQFSFVLSILDVFIPIAKLENQPKNIIISNTNCTHVLTKNVISHFFHLVVVANSAFVQHFKIVFKSKKKSFVK